MKKVIFTIFCILPAILPAQDSLSKNQKFRYGGMQQIGLVIDETGAGRNFTFTNGIRYRSVFMGVGADICYPGSIFYGSAPTNSAVFLDTRYYINKKKNFFAKADGGVNLLPFKTAYNDYNQYKKQTGAFGSVGIGFKARIGKEIFYSFDINYCVRQLRYDYSYRNWQNQWQTEKYDIRRPAIQINMGIEIF